MKSKFTLLLLLFVWCFQALAQHTTLPIAGKWQFRLDPSNIGLKENWYDQTYNQTLYLPGTLDDAGIGAPLKVDTTNLNVKVLYTLSRKHRYVGVVWYKKQIFLPASVKNAEIFLERVIWKTDCWVDGKHLGSQESLIAPHRFKVNNLKTGNHQIVLRIDNSRQYQICINDMAHAYTDGTQIIWNGVIGRMELTGENDVYINSVQLYPELGNKSLKASLSIQNSSITAIPVKLKINIWDKTRLVQTKIQDINVKAGSTDLSTKLILKNIIPWDEFKPHLYKVTVALIAKDNKTTSEKDVQFGFRQLGNTNSLIQVNGHRIFLRGILDCNIFPLEGHPPMTKPGWIKVFNTVKKYGLNHVRYHTWCPPEAAFAVADSLGVYLQVELPLWSLWVGRDKPTLTYLEGEAQQIISNYGNHPSFCFWSMGNELQGDYNWLDHLVLKLKKQDNRRLYTNSTFNIEDRHGVWPDTVDDYFVTLYTKKGWVRGEGIFSTDKPNFESDYSKAVDSIPVPLIIHEAGQYAVYPDMNEIKKYTGVLAPMNFKAIRHDLEKKHMMHLAKSFLMASGKFSANLYKEEIERALKTPGVSGIQLLDLQDFPGQGTALVGLLNAFWESKGLITDEQFRQFCSPVVPLIRFKKAAYTNTEQFIAQAQIANFSNKPLIIEPVWVITDQNNNILFRGKLKRSNVAIGNNNRLGYFKVDLNSIKHAEKLTVTLAIPKTSSRNHWNIWVYPAGISDQGSRIKFTTSAEEALSGLKNGETVILNPDTNKIKGVTGIFTPVFWSPVLFPNQPGTMGLLCDPHHPALINFPTDFYSDWQWWDLVTQSKTMIIDSLPASIHPIVRVIDNFYKNRKLADIIEMQVGQGKLLLCSMDIHSDLANRPAARQLKYSLLKYAESNDFKPSVKVEESKLKFLLK